MFGTGGYWLLVLAVGLVVAILPAAGCNSEQDKGAEIGATSEESSEAARDRAGPEPRDARPVVVIETSMGTIKAELWPDKAPTTVASFLRYADDGFFDGLIFHRVMDGFMIQGGGFDPQMRPRPTRAAIRNEASAACRNDRGTLAMARTGEIDSATSQFFINLVDNPALNHRDDTAAGFGYCVFGKVVEGMSVVDRIGKVRTVTVWRYRDVPAEPVVIKTIRRAE